MPSGNSAATSFGPSGAASVVAGHSEEYERMLEEKVEG